MKLLSAMRNFIMPPLCPGCHDCFKVKYGGRNEMCPECGMKWAAARATLCPVCAEPYHSCRCADKRLTKSGACAHVKLVPYSADSGIGNRVVHYIKKKRDTRVFAMLGRELATEIQQYHRALGLRIEDSVITYSPRRRRAVNEIGFDQAKLLADAVSRETKIPMERLILRTGVTKRAQKKLGATQRAKNARGAFRLKDGTPLKGKTVFIVDDLITTGATVGEAVRLLKKGGAAMCVAVSVAYTEKEIKKETD